MAEAKQDPRLEALRRFAGGITLLNLLGYTVLGFEQSWACPVVGVLSAYLAETFLELLDARLNGRRPRFLLGGTAPIDFLLSPHITGLAVSMLLYTNERLLPVAFAAVTAIASKYVFRVRVDGRSRHFFNPSNLGITATLLCFSWVGIGQPYMFTENLGRVGDYVMPVILVCVGSYLNAGLTKRVPLILAWLGAFVLQATVRHLLLGTELLPSLNPMTGVAFLLFTFYMVTDPATTPTTVRGQVAFGACVATAYGALMAAHVIFGLFFALSLVCAARGLGMGLQGFVEQRSAQTVTRVPSKAVNV
jgi:hypothetical protein